jgi:hypothetical protein
VLVQVVQILRKQHVHLVVHINFVYYRLRVLAICVEDKVMRRRDALLGDDDEEGLLGLRSELVSLVAMTQHT